MICEAAPGIAAAHISSYVQGQPNLVFMYERAGGGEGVPKNNETTSIMKGEFEELLEQNLVRFAQNVITHENSFESEREKLFKQIENLRYEALKLVNDHDDQRFKLTAKMGGASDDLLVALMQIFYWKRRFWRSQATRYLPIKERIRERLVGVRLEEMH
jgi:hypothetical protein